MNVRSLKVIAVVLTAFLLQGCPKGVAINLYNNSENDLIALNQNDDALQWDAGSFLSFQSEEGAWLKTVRDERGHIIPLLTVMNGTELTYYKLSFAGLPDEYIADLPGAAFAAGALEYNLQLEKDEHLYVVKPDTAFPAETILPQPLGFPIAPESENTYR